MLRPPENCSFEEKYSAVRFMFRACKTIWNLHRNAQEVYQKLYKMYKFSLLAEQLLVSTCYIDNQHESWPNGVSTLDLESHIIKWHRWGTLRRITKSCDLDISTLFSNISNMYKMSSKR